MDKYRIKVWKDFPQDHHQFYKNQSLAIYNDYVFEFQEGGRVVVVDYYTKEILSSFLLPISENNHANNSNFSNIFYDKEDEFPLLYVSRCHREYQECIVFRILCKDNSWTAIYIQSIYYKDNPNNYDTSWTIDNDNKIIYAYTYFNGNWNAPNNNKCVIYGWELPNNDKNIVLDKNEALISFEVPFCVLQGASCHDGLIYLGAHDGGYRIKRTYGIWVIDPRLKEITNKIPKEANELEGVCIYNGKLYTSNKIYSTTVKYPLTIYEYNSCY